MIQCQDMTYMGNTIYMNINGSTTKLTENIHEIEEREDGRVDIFTISEHYVVDFSNDRVKQLFVGQFKDKQGLIKNCNQCARYVSSHVHVCNNCGYNEFIQE